VRVLLQKCDNVKTFCFEKVSDWRNYFGWFSARDSIYVIARYMQSPIRPSLCPSVRLSVTRVDQSKMGWLKLRSCNFWSQSSPMTLVSSWLSSPRNSKGNIGSGGAEWERSGKNTLFSANKSPCLRNGARHDQGFYDVLIGSRICAFDWHQGRWPWMTLSSIFSEFCASWHFWEATASKRWRYRPHCQRRNCCALKDYFSTMYRLHWYCWAFLSEGWFGELCPIYQGKAGARLPLR